MYLRLTEHFKGRLPIDAGGLVFGGYQPKEVDDPYGERIAKLNFPYVVPCDKDGKYLVAVPDLPAPMPQLPTEDVKTEKPAPKSDALETEGEVAATEDALSASIEIEAPKTPKAHKAPKAPKAPKEGK